MIALLLTLWIWNYCPGEQPVAWRVESVHRYVIATTPGHDDNGTLISEPIYNVWAPTFISESADMQAEDGCEPAAGECCIVIVTSLDEWGMRDAGEDCE